MEGSANSDGPAHVDASVLTPVLNEERHISDTVTAMQAQRFDGEVEFLFMDGRSEDRTKEILEELAKSDPRIRVFDNPGRTSTAGLNVGLRHARGEYIVRMDAHTFYPEDYIARGVERLRRGDVVWVAGPQVPYGTDAWSRRGAPAPRPWAGTRGSAPLGTRDDRGGRGARRRRPPRRRGGPAPAQARGRGGGGPARRRFGWSWRSGPGGGASVSGPAGRGWARRWRRSPSSPAGAPPSRPRAARRLHRLR